MAARKKKRPFLLLEVLLAVGLIGACSQVFFETPAKAYQKQIKAIKEIELSRASFSLYTDLLCTLSKNHSWDTLKDKNTFHPLDHKIGVCLEPHLQGTFDSAYTFHLKKQKEGENNVVFALLEIKFYFKEEAETKSFEELASLKSSKLRSYTFCTLVSNSPKKRYF